MRKLIPITIFLCCVAACKSQEMVTLSGTSWKVTVLNGNDISAHEPALTITFTDKGQVNGKSGCNSFFGSYTQDGTAVTFSKLGSTRMYCDGKMQVEQEFLEGIPTVTLLKNDGEKILLKNGDKIIAILEKA